MRHVVRRCSVLGDQAQSEAAPTYVAEAIQEPRTIVENESVGVLRCIDPPNQNTLLSEKA